MKDWKYAVYVVGAILIYVIVKMMAPKEHDWRVTYAHNDKNPYGGNALYQLVPTIFNGRVKHTYSTLYELKDSISIDDNILIIANSFTGDKTDTQTILEHVNRGGNALIAAENFWGNFADTLSLYAYDYFFTTNNQNRKDSSYLSFVNHSLDTSSRYWFLRDNIHNYFNRFDTLRTTSIAENDNAQPVAIRMKIGEGNLILSTTPLAFTNIYLLSEENHKYVSSLLSYLSGKNLHWTEYYHLGRMEPQSQLRFILRSEPLRWAYYLTVVSILLFMIFEAKRKQRIIPVMKPPSNTSLEFVHTIGNLYYQHGDHKNLAEKKISFFFEHVRSRYLLRTTNIDEDFIFALSSKSGVPEQDVRVLIQSIRYIQSSTMISPGQLMDLNQKLDAFKEREK